MCSQIPDVYNSQCQVRPYAHIFQMFTTSQSQDRPLRSQILGGYNLTMSSWPMRSQIPGGYNLTMSSLPMRLQFTGGYNLTMSSLPMRSQISSGYNLTKSNNAHALTNFNCLQPAKVKLGPCALKFQMFTTWQWQVSSCAHKFQMFTTHSVKLGHAFVYNLIKSNYAQAPTNFKCLQPEKVKLGSVLGIQFLQIFF